MAGGNDTTYLVVHPGNLLASPFVPHLTLRHKVRLKTHDPNKDRSNGQSDECQLPSPNHCPDETDGHHGANGHDLAYHDSDQRTSIVTIFHNDLSEPRCAILGTVEPALVLAENTG